MAQIPSIDSSRMRWRAVDAATPFDSSRKLSGVEKCHPPFACLSGCTQGKLLSRCSCLQNECRTRPQRPSFVSLRPAPRPHQICPVLLGSSPCVRIVFDNKRAAGIDHRCSIPRAAFMSMRPAWRDYCGRRGSAVVCGFSSKFT